jgi:hypothetical protein
MATTVIGSTRHDKEGLLAIALTAAIRCLATHVMTALNAVAPNATALNAVAHDSAQCGSAQCDSAQCGSA